ncbi:putative methyltransferase-domain-containing protein, partial [Russula dissimulans]
EAPRPPSPEPTTAVYENVEDDRRHRHPPWNAISVRLVGNHPLWGHHLWNAARSLAAFLQRTPELYVARTVLELGAGGGLPGLVAAKCGARKVVLTDYPDQALLDNLVYNVKQNVEPARRGALCVRGYVWGRPLDSDADLALRLGPGPGTSSSFFDLVLLSDLIFNHSQHRALLTTCERALAPGGGGGGCVLVFYTHHRPHLAHRDMAFFEMAREMGWECEEVLTERFPPMFPGDSGEEEVRSTVHGWKLTRSRRDRWRK